MEETWKRFRITSSYFWEVSFEGKVRKQSKRNKNYSDVNNFSKDKNGYLYLDLLNADGVNTDRLYLHELVAEMFLEKEFPEGNYVKHKNSNILDNFKNNLEYIFIDDAKNNNLPMPVRLRVLKNNKINLELRMIEDCDELWKTCKTDDSYIISSFGNVKNSNGAYIKEFNTIKDYIILPSFDDEKEKPINLFLHVEVAKLFCSDFSETRKYVRHKNGNKLDNFYKNLEYVSHYEMYKEHIKSSRMNCYYKNKTTKSVKIEEVDEEKLQHKKQIKKEINKRYYQKKKLSREKQEEVNYYIQQIDNNIEKIEKLSKSLEN
jgi:hypothetical protein